MPERVYFCFCGDNCKFETMTKEQIITAIYQAVTTGEIKDIDAGFISTVIEKNKGNGLTFWQGTTAEFNAIVDKDPNCFYIRIDDKTIEVINKTIEAQAKQISDLQTENAKLIQEQEALKSEMFYEDGESVIISDLVVNGFITTAATALVFFVPLRKKVNTRYAHINEFTALARGVSGYLYGADFADFAISPFTVTHNVTDNGLRISITIGNEAQFTNAVNNTPIALQVRRLQIYFSNEAAPYQPEK